MTCNEAFCIPTPQVSGDAVIAKLAVEFKSVNAVVSAKNDCVFLIINFVLFLRIDCGSAADQQCC